MQTILDFNFEKLKEIILSLNEPSFRSKQLFEGLHSGKKLEEISNISKAFKEKLLSKYLDFPAEIYKKLESKDGTKKYVFKYLDGNIVEGVLMKYKYGYTLCVSTQVGCRMNCSFCASGLNGLIRNLSCGEILAEVLLVNRDLGGGVKDRKITNLVLMGSGEPLDNYAEVVNFLKIISSPESLNISPRNISLSTCGLIDKIDRLSKENLPITLTISLHAPNGQIREKIMPVAKAYKYDELIKCAKRYFKNTGRRVVYEYALIAGVNDSLKNAEELARNLKGDYSFHVNIIPLNEVKERGLKSSKNAYTFMNALEKVGVSATVRRTMGEDIEGACGQLRNKILKDENL